MSRFEHTISDRPLAQQESLAMNDFYGNPHDHMIGAGRPRFGQTPRTMSAGAGSLLYDTYDFRDINDPDMFLGREHFNQFGAPRGLGSFVIGKAFHTLVDGGPLMSTVEMCLARKTPQDRLLIPVPLDGITILKRKDAGLDPHMFNLRPSGNRTKVHLLAWAVQAGGIIALGKRIAQDNQDLDSLAKYKLTIVDMATALRDQLA